MVSHDSRLSAHRRDPHAYVRRPPTIQNEAISVRQFKVKSTQVVRSSTESPYRHELPPLDGRDCFDHEASVGFIQLFGLPVRTQAEVQGEAE